MLVETTILDRHRGVFHIFTNLLRVNHQTIFACTGIFPEKLTIAIVVFGNGSLDSLSQLGRLKALELIAEIKVSADTYQHQQKQGDSKDLTQHLESVHREPKLSQVPGIEPSQQALGRILR